MMKYFLDSALSDGRDASGARRLIRSAAVWFVLLLVIGLDHSAVAQSRVGTTAAPFLTLGTGARGSALGHAYTAMASGPDALFWNPGAASVPHRGEYRGGAFFTHHNWFAGINYNAAAVVVPVTGSGVIGLSLASVDYGRMDVTTVFDPDGTGETFTATDLAIGVTYSTPLTPSFYFGGTAKYIRQSIRDMSAQTGAVDFGFVLTTNYLNGMKIAATLMNFGGKMTMSGVNSQIAVDVAQNISGSNEDIPAELKMDSWNLPLQFKFGVALPVVDMNNVQFVVLADANQSNDNDLNSDLGAQLRYDTRTVTFDARFGYKDLFLDDNVDSHFSYGAGLEVRVSKVRFGFDYSYVPFDALSDTQMIDFRVYF